MSGSRRTFLSSKRRAHLYINMHIRARIICVCTAYTLIGYFQLTHRLPARRLVCARVYITILSQYYTRRSKPTGARFSDDDRKLVI